MDQKTLTNSFFPPNYNPPKLMPGMVWIRKDYVLDDGQKITKWHISSTLPEDLSFICFCWETGEMYLENDYGYCENINSLEEGSRKIENHINDTLEKYCEFAGKIALKKKLDK